MITEDTTVHTLIMVPETTIELGVGDNMAGG